MTRLGIGTKKTLQQLCVIRLSDSGGGGGVVCLSQTLKALCAFVNLHSHDTHNEHNIPLLLLLIIVRVVNALHKGFAVVNLDK